MNLSDPPLTASAQLCNFNYLPAESLARLAAEHGLALTPQMLLYCQGFFRTTLYRNPTLSELRFFDGVLRQWRRMPGGVRISGLAGADAEGALVWQDICRKSAELEQNTPPSLSQLSELCGRALARAGIYAKTPDLFVGTGAELAAQCNGHAPELVLDLGSTAAALTEEYSTRIPPEAMLFLFSPTTEDAASEIAAFLTAHRGMRLCPVAFTADEGILPHLCALNVGLDVDYALLPGYTPEDGPTVLLHAGKNALLFFATRYAAQCLQGESLPGLLLFGSVINAQRLTLRAGTQSALPLPHYFFSVLRESENKVLHPVKIPCAQGEVQIKAAAGRLLAGVRAGCDTLGAILDATAALAQAGAVLSTMQLGTVLELPDSGERAFEEALPLLFGVHRAAAELLLPSKRHRQLQRDSLEHPRLSVFLLAKAGEAPPPERLASIRGAAKTRDLAALRALFFGKK